MISNDYVPVGVVDEVVVAQQFCSAGLRDSTMRTVATLSEHWFARRRAGFCGSSRIYDWSGGLSSRYQIEVSVSPICSPTIGRLPSVFAA